MNNDEVKAKLVLLEQGRRDAKRAVDEAERASLKIPALLGFSLEEILRHEFPRRRVLLQRGEHAILRAGNIAQIFAYRGVGKTWLFETLALIAAYRVEALGLKAPEPVRVLYVDGEMASEDVQTRLRLLCEMLRVPRQLGIGAERRLTIVGADWQEEYLPRLDTLEGQRAIETFVEPADLILLDNRSSLFDPEGEKDPTAWQPAQDWLLSLRRRGKAVVMAHHANRVGGARGLSKAEDVIDLNLKLSRPEGYTADQGARFLLEFDKARAVHGDAAASFVAGLGSEGWTVEGTSVPVDNLTARLRDHLAVAARLGESPKTATAAVMGAKVNKAEGLKAIAAWLEDGTVRKTDRGIVLAEVGENSEF